LCFLQFWKFFNVYFSYCCVEQVALLWWFHHKSSRGGSGWCVAVCTHPPVVFLVFFNVFSMFLYSLILCFLCFFVFLFFQCFYILWYCVFYHQIVVSCVAIIVSLQIVEKKKHGA
jgi:hypothetical protein